MKVGSELGWQSQTLRWTLPRMGQGSATNELNLASTQRNSNSLMRKIQPRPRLKIYFYYFIYLNSEIKLDIIYLNCATAGLKSSSYEMVFLSFDISFFYLKGFSVSFDVYFFPFKTFSLLIYIIYIYINLFFHFTCCFSFIFWYTYLVISYFSLVI